MISNTLKLAAAVGVAAAMVFSAASAEARSARRDHAVRGPVASDTYIYGPASAPDDLPFGPYYGPQAASPFAYAPADAFGYAPADAFGYAPSFGNAYGSIDDGVGYSGSGTFSDGREVPATNWNPNQN
jgi:hypothetical protein